MGIMLDEMAEIAGGAQELPDSGHGSGVTITAMF